MVRTKKHFRPPSSDSSSASSSEEDDEDEEIIDEQTMAQRGRGKQMIFGRGKQLPSAAAPPPAPPAHGRGKQLRAPEPQRDESDDDDVDGSSDENSSGSSDDEDDDDEEELALVPPPASAPAPSSASRGKQLARPAPAPVGRGKMLRAPSSPAPVVAAPVVAAPVVAAPVQFGRSMGKQLAIQAVGTAADDDDDDSDSSSDEEPWTAPAQPAAVVHQRGMGKQLRLPTPSDTADKDESDMEESSSSEEEDEEEEEKGMEAEDAKVAEPPPPRPAAAKAKATAPPNKKSPKRPVEPEEESEEESDFEPDEPKRGKGRPPARAAATRATRSAKAAAKKEISSDEEEEEEGEEEDDDESEEEGSDDESSDEEQEWDMETFDTQKLMQGADDKKYLDSLPELEREGILAERFEKLKSEADMKKAIRENKRKERETKKPAGPKKKKAATKRGAPAKGKKAPPAKKTRGAKKKAESESEDDDDDFEGEEAPDTSADGLLAQSLAGKRVSTRNLDKKGKHFKKQAALARIRETRASKQTTAEGESESDLDYGRDSDDSDDDYEESTMLKPWQQQKGKKKQMSDSSDDESMGADDDDQQMPKGSIETRTEDTEASLEDYYKVSIPRRRLMRWCNEPYFEVAVKNFYVRLGIGRDTLTQKPCYRLCRIIGVVIKSEYKFSADPNQKQISTNKYLKVAFGKTLGEFKMLTVSDHRPSPEDVNKLVSQLKLERLTDSLLTKKSANKLRKRQDELLNNYTYTKEDVDMLVIEKKKRNNKTSNIGLEKTLIAISVQAANDEVDDAKKRLEDAEVERMEADDDEDLAGAAESDVKRAKEELERANIKLAERIEEQKRIQKEEEDRTSRLKKSSKVQNWLKVNQRAKLANKNADFESYKEQLAREKIQGSVEPRFDPYARRTMKPKNLWEVAGPKQSNNTTGSSGVIEEEKKEATERDDANVGKDGEKENTREDIPEPQKMDFPGQSNQLAFDDDLVIGGDIANMGGIGAKKVRARVRKGLSLEEYQERKAVGTL